MDTALIVLCVALTVVIAVALIGETVRLGNGYRSLKEDSQKRNRETPRIVVVRQKEGEVRLAYLVTPDDTYRGEVAATCEEQAPAVREPESVVLPKAEKLTYEEKYEKLDETDRRLIDEFAAFVSALPDCSRSLQTSALAFKYKKGHIAKAVIRRDTVVLHFSIANPELDRLVREEKLKEVKVKPVEIRLGSEEDLALAKQTAEITVKYLREEENYRLEKRREARREAAKKKRAELGSTAFGEEGK